MIKRTLWPDILLGAIIGMALLLFVVEVYAATSTVYFGPDQTCRAYDNFRKIPCDHWGNQ